MGQWHSVTLHGLRATLSLLPYLSLGHRISVRQYARLIVRMYRFGDANEHYLASSLFLLDEAPAFATLFGQSSCYKLQSNVQHRHSRSGITQHSMKAVQPN